jgi:poly(3-hydroxybutyrate) depolymerase
MALYGVRELVFQPLQPLRLMADASQQALSLWGDYVTWIPGMREVAAALEVLSRLAVGHEKPSFCVEYVSVSGRPAAVTEKVLLDRPFCQLLHFQKDEICPGPKVLLLAPLSGHHATLLRSTVEALLPEHDVYITDWADARLVPLEAGRFDLSFYVEYLKEFLRYLGPDTHVVAVCQPAVPSLCAVAHMAEDDEFGQPRSMTLIAGPVDTRKSPTAVNRFAQAHTLRWFESHVIERVPPHYPGKGRLVYPGFLQLACFVSMNAWRHVEAHIDFFQSLVKGNKDKVARHDKFYHEYAAVLDMPAEYYLETIQKVFREHHLPRGRMEVAGRTVRPEAITKIALLTIEGRRDDITGQGQTKAAHALCKGIPAQRRRHVIVDGAGHFVMFSGRKFSESILPTIARFVRAHAT